MKIAYDVKLMRPGCVLLQVAFGCDRSMATIFDSKYWLVGLTPDLHVYDVTTEQLKQLVEKTKDTNWSLK